MTKIILRIAIVVFSVELMVMFFLAMMDLRLSVFAEAWLDAALLTLFISPIIWLWVISPYVSAHQQAECRLQQFNSDLEAKIKEKTKDLQRAKEEAEQANFAKSEFLSRVSHELRTPLNAILGFSHLMMVDNQSPAENVNKEFATQIYDSGTHLLDLINEILDLASIETGRVAVKMDEVCLNETILRCLQMMEPLAEDKNVVIELHNDVDDATMVSADKNRLTEVLLNLLSNAVKYNKKDGKIILSVNRREETMIIRVTDTGKGLSLAQQKKLFQPMERLGAEYSDIEGTGIGLTISKHLVELMGGVIGVESIEGKGSTFWIELKKSHSPPQSSQAVTQVLPVEPIQPIEPTTNLVNKDSDFYTVLYIEDNQLNLALVERILKSQKNIQFLFSKSPIEGIEMALAHQPDLVLLDINLPEIDGYEVLKRLKTMSETKHINVIAVSAEAMSSDLQKAKQKGFETYITKPINIPYFIKTVTNCLENTKRVSSF